MDTPREKDQVFDDYAAWFKALLPDATGFLCYDRHGRVFWRNGDKAQDFTPDYKSALAGLLSGDSDAELQAVDMDPGGAVLFPLTGSNTESHGVLAVIMSSLPLDPAALRQSLQPAIRTMQRELDLRFRLLENQRRLVVQAAEEKLLHHVESLVHKPQSSEASLRRILELCRKYLAVERAGIVVEGRGIRLLDADGLKGEERDVALKHMMNPDGGDKSMADLVTMPLEGIVTAGGGKLLLQGWSDSQFSRRRARRVARYLASHAVSALERDTDTLTGLPAWSVFEAQLQAACQSDDRADSLLMYLDVDQLHVINQNYGREIGDEVLRAFARILRTWFGTNLVTRISSDSFAALLEDLSPHEARQLGEDTCRRFHELEFFGAGKSFHAGVCVGIAPLTAGEKGASRSLAAAQVACRAAKDRGGNRVEAYEPADQSIMQRLDDIQLVGSVRAAIGEDRLVLLGQPILPLKRGNDLRYFEVLVRMLDEQGRMLPPAEFLSAAERYQLMDELDRRVVRMSLRMLAENGLRRRDSGVRLAINLSGQSLGNEGFLHFVKDEIEAMRVAPELLCFEITETVAVANMQRAQAFMHSLRKMGCRFSLDDFGTGLSSFSYLKLFPIDTLKIDGSFVKDIATNVVSQSVVAALSEVARVMELETVAEYVEKEDSLRLLRDLNVTWGQGYLLGEPVRLEEALVADRPSTCESAVTRKSL
ncbi:MAG: bifunctional diguanylate cyclase/phosphodiesterase [Gammaproteobacteria bacterium]|nr:bifunctional diguanylate cyclase/phosphodiesterase [Gammaproteobacteria bacterium]